MSPPTADDSAEGRRWFGPAVLTGLVGAGSLRIGFAVPMVLVLAIVVLAPAFVAGERVTESATG